MQLEVSVHMYGAPVPAQSWTVTHLDEAEGIGAKVGRVVRDFVRTRPLRKGGTRLQLDVRAIWRVDRLPAPEKPAKKRRGKKGKPNGASE